MSTDVGEVHSAYQIWPALWGSLKKIERQYGVHTVTASAATKFIKELQAGDLVVIKFRVVRIGRKSCSFELRMKHMDTDEVHAEYSIVEVFFDPITRSSAPIPSAILDCLS
ncbi:acyl-CoA thioesterase [Sedimenticola sp.]|uniref:acyl-CoA thioesterase n=1 Tax=Sedimenticola sp. TaxID=1940285 RepID=UPI003D11658C